MLTHLRIKKSYLWGFQENRLIINRTKSTLCDPLSIILVGRVKTLQQCQQNKVGTLTSLLCIHIYLLFIIYKWQYTRPTFHSFRLSNLESCWKHTSVSWRWLNTDKEDPCPPLLYDGGSTSTFSNPGLFRHLPLQLPPSSPATQLAGLMGIIAESTRRVLG